jgi:hypothetical protein
MNRRRELPPELQGRAFRVGDALSAGVTARRLDASDLEAPLHGARGPRHVSNLDAVAALLRPGQAFTGPTAAVIWGMPLPLRWQNDSRLWVSTLSRNWTMRRPDVVGRRRSAGDVMSLNGYPVLDPVRTWCSLAPLLELHDLVAVADRIVTSSRRAPALAEAHRLHTAASTAARGSRALRAALLESRAGAWSRPESLLRIAATRAGLPEPDLNTGVPVGAGRVAAPETSGRRSGAT